MNSNSFESDGIPSADTIFVQRVAAVAVVFALVLAGVKLSLFMLSGSLVIALSAWDSAADAVVSFVNRIVLKYARQDADEEHPYGHGKAETLAAVAQGAVIMSGGIMIFVASINMLIAIVKGKSDVSIPSWLGALFFVGAAAASAVLAFWLRKQSQRFESAALFADSQHYQMDVLTNLGSAASLAAILLTNIAWLDPLIASGFAIYVAWSGLSLLRTNIGDLMDKDVPDELKQQALDVILSVSPSIIDVHNFRGRKSGKATFFDFHVTLPTDFPFEQVHEVMEAIENTLRVRFGGDCFVHPDPDCVPLSERERPYSRRPAQS